MVFEQASDRQNNDDFMQENHTVCEIAHPLHFYGRQLGVPRGSPWLMLPKTDKLSIFDHGSEIFSNAGKKNYLMKAFTPINYTILDLAANKFNIGEEDFRAALKLQGDEPGPSPAK